MAFALPSEVRAWLSGGAANVDADASLGGARSTVQDAGVFYSDDSLFTWPRVFGGGVTVTGSWTTSFDVPIDAGQWWTGFVTPDPIVLELDGTTGAANNLSVAGPAGTGSALLHEFDDADDYIFHRFDVSVDYAALVTGPPEIPQRVEYNHELQLDRLISTIPLDPLGLSFTIYRCMYIRNTGVDPTPDLDMGSDIFGVTYTDGVSVEVGLGTSAIDGVEQTIADEATAPVGVTFSAPAGSIVFPALATNEHKALWIRLIFPVSFNPAGASDKIIIWGRDSDAPNEETYSFGFEWSFVQSDAVEELITFTDAAEAESGWPVESITFTDEATAQKVSYADIVDGIVFTDETTALRVLTADIVDSVLFEDEAASQAIFYADLVDAIAFFDETNTIGGQREGWTLNLDTNAMSRYLWGPFTSFARFGGRHYAVTNDGVFLLEGGTDDGLDINAFVLLGIDDLGEEFKKRVKAVYLGVRSTGSLLLKVVVDETTYVYTVQTQGMDALKRARGTVGLGLYGNYWQFGLENADGVDFELESVKILPLKPIVDGRRKD